MKILVLFSKYFLILSVTQGLITYVFDYRHFKKLNMKNNAKKAKIIASGLIFISILLFVVSSLMG